MKNAKYLLIVSSLFLFGCTNPLPLQRTLERTSKIAVTQSGGLVTIGRAKDTVSVLLFASSNSPSSLDFFHEVLPVLHRKVLSGGVTLSLVHGSLSKYPDTATAALFLCAYDLQKFPEFLTSLQSWSGSTSDDQLKNCLFSHQNDERLRMAQALQKTFGVDRLPTYFINNQKYIGVPSTEVFAAQIESARALKN